MTTQVTARPAATIVLMRDSAQGPEVFMVVRHHAIAFAAGALVFPGGRVEDSDRAYAADLPDIGPTIPPDATAYRLAAIRETFEECGVLFARPNASPHLIGAETLLAVETAHRDALNNGEIDLRAMLDAHALTPATDLLTHFAHWITPANQAKRYDTQFFLAKAPAEHLAVHDGTEAVDSLWITPQKALDDTIAGRFKLIFATEMNLKKLADHATTAAAIAAARASTIVTVQPELRAVDGHRRLLRIPIEAGYGGDEFMVDNPPGS